MHKHGVVGMDGMCWTGSRGDTRGSSVSRRDYYLPSVDMLTAQVCNHKESCLLSLINKTVLNNCFIFQRIYSPLSCWILILSKSWRRSQLTLQLVCFLHYCYFFIVTGSNFIIITAFLFNFCLYRYESMHVPSAT